MRKPNTLSRFSSLIPSLWQGKGWVFVFVLLFASCSSSDDEPELTAVTEVEVPVKVLPPARVTQTIHREDAKATIYNIEYPSVDPYGNPETLSGSIILGDEVEKDGRQARGMVLYNHYTVYHKDQCPSQGDIDILLKVVGSKLIAVAADYYGFGATADKNQAYCIASANAQASIDCLLAAHTLLKDMGYLWGDFLFNLGYSEGGQTSMGVLRLCAERYPDIRFTHTIAGGGPYDIGETYRQLVSSGKTSMPSTVISTLLAYNEYYKLGVNNSEMFLEPTLSNIGKYLLSKDYQRSDMETRLASEKISDWVTPVMLDMTSGLSMKFMNVFEKENLSAGWVPRKNEHISLVHNKLDACVPYANTTQMMDFFRQNGFSVTDDSDKRFADGYVYVYAGYWDINLLSKKLGNHEFGAIPFVTELIQVICHHLGIKPWFSITKEDIEGLF